MNNTLIVLALLLLVVILANVADVRPGLRSLTYGILLAIITAFVVAFGFFVPVAASLSFEQLLAARFAAAIVGINATLLIFLPVRRWAARVLPPRQVAQGLGFDPTSTVHATALILCVLLVGYTILNFVIAGGLAGLAQNYEGISPVGLLSQMMIFIAFAFLGSGLTVRRPLRQTLRRLGLRAPTPREVFIGVGMAALMFTFNFAFAVIMSQVMSAEAIRQQSEFSGQIASSVTTLGLALLIAFTAAVGEEIAFRGALQPIFGLTLTSLFFAAIHVQYTLTPASGLILLLAVVLGWLRRRYNTTVAIIAHFLYNFVLLFFAVIAVYSQQIQQMVR